MSLHTLHLTIDGARYDTIEAEVITRVMAYTGWDHDKAQARVNHHATIDLQPIDRRPRLGVVYRATVTITV